MRGNFILKVNSYKPLCTLFVLFAVLSQVSTCPSLCQCDVQGGQKYVQCNKVNLSVLPPEIPSDTELLILSSTKIKKLTENYFSRLSNLKTIELSNNQIENITNGVFNGLSMLKRLNLANNRIRRVSSRAFTGLSSLTKLSLSNNQLLSLPQNLIKDLKNLEILNLDKNSLQNFQSGFLNNTPNLIRLNLNSNNLTRIDTELLQSLKRLSYLDLSNNQITEIAEHAFRAPGAKLTFLSLDGNKIASFPGALFDLKPPFGILNLLLQNNRITTIPKEAETIFNKIKFGKIRLSGNPYICDSSLRWLQTWTNGSNIAVDRDDVTCITQGGLKMKLSEYDFQKTVSQLTGKSTTVAPTATASSSTTITTRSASNLQRISSTATSPVLNPSTTNTPLTTVITTQETTDTVSTNLVPATTTKPESSPTQGEQTTAVVSSNTMEIPTTSEVVTISYDNVSSTQQIPVTTSSSSLQSSSNTTSLTSTGKVNKKVVLRKEHIILATCLSAVFIAVVVFVAMYCFRKKIIKRDKLVSTRYDRARIV